MFNVFGHLSEKKRKLAREKELKQSLSDKLMHQTQNDMTLPINASDDTDYTEITFHGVKTLFKKENITICDVSAK